MVIRATTIHERHGGAGEYAAYFASAFIRVDFDVNLCLPYIIVGSSLILISAFTSWPDAASSQ